jgi:protocatechuate 3,4-dioxygenase beta subunit
MSTENEKSSRRQFLRNTAITGLGVGLLPNLIGSASAKETETNKACPPITLDYYGQGPFYTAGAPTLVNNQLAAVGEPGTRLILTGVVRTLDCTKVIPDTTIDVWQANDAGAYDNTGFKLRGVTKSNAQGFYLIETILPGKYLNGSSYRPRHIHFKITPPGFPTIITQLYFEGDTEIPGDAAASIKSGTYDATNRIIPITLNGQGKYEGTWDIAINGNGTIGIGEIHLDRGMIYSVSPNPFTDELEINYGVFQKAKVSIQVFDIRGALVAVLDQKELEPLKYKAVWKPEINLPKGVFWVALKLNDLQVHYLKVERV